MHEAKSQEITLIEKRNAEAEADHQKKVAEYNQQKAAMTLLEEYNAKAAYDAKVVEKAAADKAMQKQKPSMMQKWLFTIQRKRTMKDLQEYQTKKAQYDKDKAAYDQLVAKAEEDAAKAQYEADLCKIQCRKSTVRK